MVVQSGQKSEGLGIISQSLYGCVGICLVAILVVKAPALNP